MKGRGFHKGKYWQRRTQSRSYVTHTTMRVNSNKKWHFDSACSRHMTGVSQFLTNIKYGRSEVVTFGDGAQGSVLGK